MSRPRLLDLFCGAGGAGMGYHRAGFDVVGVDIKPQPRYPFEFHQWDARDVGLVDFGTGNVGATLGATSDTLKAIGLFQAIHASPPCQRYSRCTMRAGDRATHPDLLVPTVEQLETVRVPWAIENVVGAPFPERCYVVTLCGSSFGLPMLRHRHFATNVAMLVPPCNHGKSADLIGVYGHSDGKHAPGFKHPGRARGPRQATTAECIEAMGMPWAKTRHEVTEAIPPAYTEFIGAALLRHLGVAA